MWACLREVAYCLQEVHTHWQITFTNVNSSLCVHAQLSNEYCYRLMHLEPCITAPRQIFLLIQSGVIDQMQPLCACYPLELEQTWGRSVWRHWASVLLWGGENDFSPCEEVMALSDCHHKHAKSECSERSSSVLSLVGENKAAYHICFNLCTSSNMLWGPASSASLLWDTWSMKHLSQLSQSLGQVIAVAQGLGTSHLQIILNAGRCVCLFSVDFSTVSSPPPHTHTHT